MKLLIAVISIFIFLPLESANANLRIDGISLNQKSFDVSASQSLGGNERGPALGVLSNGSLILGGGDKGGTLFLWSEKDAKLRTLGDFINPKERIRDSRFAITDIAILKENVNSTNILISFPRLTNRNCVEVVVDEISLNLNTTSAKKINRWFTSKPCVAVSAVQHAAGRMEVINNKSVYLTIGDLATEKLIRGA